MITKATEVQITILPDAQMQVREQTVIYEDGVEIARQAPHRHVVAPGDDVASEPEIVRDAATGIHTAARVQAYREAKGRPESARG